MITLNNFKEDYLEIKSNLDIKLKNYLNIIFIFWGQKYKN